MPSSSPSAKQILPRNCWNSLHRSGGSRWLLAWLLVRQALMLFCAAVISSFPPDSRENSILTSTHFVCCRLHVRISITVAVRQRAREIVSLPMNDSCMLARSRYPLVACCIATQYCWEEITRRRRRRRRRPLEPPPSSSERERPSIKFASETLLLLLVMTTTSAKTKWMLSVGVG